MPKTTLIFDFDGTIANTLDVFIKLYNAAAPKFHCKTISPQDLNKLRASRPQTFLKDYGVTTLKIPFLVLSLRKDLRGKIKEIHPFEGIIPALKALKTAGFQLGIMTSNSKENVKIFLAANQITDLFHFIHSSKNIFGKEHALKRLLAKYQIEKSTAAYLGDETRDVEAAKKAGITAVAVAWGFNSREILATLQPDAIIDNPKELLASLGKL